MTRMQRGPGNTRRGCDSVMRLLQIRWCQTPAPPPHSVNIDTVRRTCCLVAAIYGWSNVIHKGVEMDLSKTQVGIWEMLISNGPWVKKKRKKEKDPPHHCTCSGSQDCYWYIAGWIHYFKFGFHHNLSQLKSRLIVIFIVVEKTKKKND